MLPLSNGALWVASKAARHTAQMAHPAVCSLLQHRHMTASEDAVIILRRCGHHNRQKCKGGNSQFYFHRMGVKSLVSRKYLLLPTPSDNEEDGWNYYQAEQPQSHPKSYCQPLIRS